MPGDQHFSIQPLPKILLNSPIRQNWSLISIREKLQSVDEVQLPTCSKGSRHRLHLSNTSCIGANQLVSDRMFPAATVLSRASPLAVFNLLLPPHNQIPSIARATPPSHYDEQLPSLSVHRQNLQIAREFSEHSLILFAPMIQPPSLVPQVFDY
jgi:hypothetical protein